MMIYRLILQTIIIGQMMSYRREESNGREDDGDVADDEKINKLNVVSLSVSSMS